MRIYKTKKGILVAYRQSYFLNQQIDWDDFIRQDDLYGSITKTLSNWQSVADEHPLLTHELLPPIGTQEVWASGVTYYRSRDARMEESKAAGGGDFYDRVYAASRPELFFKATPSRVAGHQQQVRIRKDSTWNVPEPELTLLISASGKITGYTIGNDMSSRSIEGDNPLYLPQAKTYDKSAALGPCIYVSPDPLPQNTSITMTIERAGKLIFEGNIGIDQMKRRPQELVEYLFKECSFPQGCFLMTGTGIIPDNDFTLASGDLISITMEPVGTLVNTVA